MGLLESAKALPSARWMLSRQAILLAATFLSLAAIYTVYSLHDDLQTPHWLSLGSGGGDSGTSCSTQTRPVTAGPSTPVYPPIQGNEDEEAGSVSPLEGVRVIGLVFYGRRELVSILDCYLKVSNFERERLRIERQDTHSKNNTAESQSKWRPA